MYATHARTLAATVLVSALALGACSTAPTEPVVVENAKTISATVESVDVPKRLVSLRGPQGRTATVEVSPAIYNLGQVKAGDKVVVRYYEAAAAQLKKKGESTTLNSVDVKDVAGTAAPGAKPAAIAGSKVTTTVVIDSVDQSFNTVTFKGTSGMLRTVGIDNPEAQQFIKRLKKGDEVEVTYTEALAISVEPAS